MGTLQIYLVNPCKITPYILLPSGTWLVYLPAASSIAMAAAPGHLPDLQVLALFGLGSFLMRGAGCTVNDMWDKDIDRQVVKALNKRVLCGTL